MHTRYTAWFCFPGIGQYAFSRQMLSSVYKSLKDIKEEQCLLETKGHLYYIHTLYDGDNIKYQNGITTLYKILYWTSRFLYNDHFLRWTIKANWNVYWRIWSILQPEWEVLCIQQYFARSEKSLVMRCNCMQEDTTHCSITIARRRQTLLRGTWNAGNRQSSPPSIYILHCKGQS